MGPACEPAWLQADAVFVGRVYWTELLPTKDHGGSTLHRIATVKTLEPFIGNISGWVSVETGSGGGDCGYDFGLGEEYLFYARRQKDGSLTTSICTRTQKISDASADLTYLRTIKSAASRRHKSAIAQTDKRGPKESRQAIRWMEGGAREDKVL